MDALLERSHKLLSALRSNGIDQDDIDQELILALNSLIDGETVHMERFANISMDLYESKKGINTQEQKQRKQSEVIQQRYLKVTEKSLNMAHLVEEYEVIDATKKENEELRRRLESVYNDNSELQSQLTKATERFQFFKKKAKELETTLENAKLEKSHRTEYKQTEVDQGSKGDPEVASSQNTIKDLELESEKSKFSQETTETVDEPSKQFLQENSDHSATVLDRSVKKETEEYLQKIRKLQDIIVNLKEELELAEELLQYQKSKLARDETVRKLKEKMIGLEETGTQTLYDFEEYKKYTSQLLTSERKLNEELRHLRLT